MSCALEINNKDEFKPEEVESCSSTTKNVISITTMLMVTKLDWVVTYSEGLQPIKSNNSLITWSCEISCQNKNFVSLLPEWLWPPNLAGW